MSFSFKSSKFGILFLNAPSVFKILSGVLSFYAIERQEAVWKTTDVRLLPRCYGSTCARACKYLERIPKAVTLLANLWISLFKISLEKKGFLKERSQTILVSLVMRLMRNN